jgi:hypothetical protein
MLRGAYDIVEACKSTLGIEVGGKEEQEEEQGEEEEEEGAKKMKKRGKEREHLENEET